MDLATILVIVNALLVTLMVSEGLFNQYVRKHESPWKEMIYNLNSGHLLMWVCRGIEIVGYYYILTYSPYRLFDGLPIWQTFIIAFIAWDFGFYWFHRAHHKFSALWVLHNVHHQGENYNLSLGIRNAWFSSLTALPFYALLAVAGLPVEMFITVASIHIVIQFYNHNSIVNKSGILEIFMITPSHHRVHHGTQDIYVDKNFGGTFVIWDKLFGTFQVELDELPVKYGSHDKVETSNVFWGNMIPILRWLGFKVENPVVGNYRIPAYQIVINGILVFGLYVQYLIYEIGGNFSDMAIIFAIGFAGTLGLGFISDQKLLGYRLNLFTSVILSSIYFLFFRINDIYLEVNIMLIILSNLVMYLTFEDISFDITSELPEHIDTVI